MMIIRYWKLYRQCWLTGEKQMMWGPQVSQNPAKGVYRMQSKEGGETQTRGSLSWEDKSSKFRQVRWLEFQITTLESNSKYLHVFEHWPGCESQGITTYGEKTSQRNRRNYRQCSPEVGKSSSSHSSCAKVPKKQGRNRGKQKK